MASLSELRTELKNVLAKHKIRLKRTPSSAELGDFLAGMFTELLEMPGVAAKLRAHMKNVWKELADVEEAAPAEGKKPGAPQPAGGIPGVTPAKTSERVLSRYLGSA